MPRATTTPEMKSNAVVMAVGVTACSRRATGSSGSSGTRPAIKRYQRHSGDGGDDDQLCAQRSMRLPGDGQGDRDEQDGDKERQDLGRAVAELLGWADDVKPDGDRD